MINRKSLGAKIQGDISLNYLEQNAELSVIFPEFPDNRYSILSCIVF